jgi:hypothetical protein
LHGFYKAIRKTDNHYTQVGGQKVRHGATRANANYPYRRPLPTMQKTQIINMIAKLNR